MKLEKLEKNIILGTKRAFMMALKITQILIILILIMSLHFEKYYQ